MSAVSGIVGIHGVPRSGTTWLGQLFNSSPEVAYRYQPFFSYAFRGRIDVESSVDEIHAFFADLLDTADDFVLQRGRARLSLAATEFDKSSPRHLVYKEVRFHHLLPRLLESVPALRVVGIVRDPRSVIASWIRAPREFDPAWSIDEEWKHAPAKNAGLEENWYGYDRWKQFVELLEGLRGRHPDRLRIIRYEDLAASTDEVVGDLFRFAGLELAEPSRRFIRESTSRDDGDPYGVFRKRGADRAGVRDLPSHVAARIEDELRDTALARYLEP